MCGFTGYFGGTDFDRIDPKIQLKKMADTLIHRGPDSEGYWMDGDAHIALAHRRLAILDLSPQGHQPMTSVSSRYVIAFNGEIYNHLDIRTELDNKLQGSTWRGHSDTETLLAAIEFWGVEDTLKNCVGMFAFALWDHKEQALYLVRDRFGEKPLYYGWQNGTLLFGSELKSLVQHVDFSGKINREALDLFLKYNYIPAPYSIWQGIHKLPAGTFIKISKNLVGKPEAYWSLKDVAERGVESPLILSDQDAILQLDTVLRTAVKGQMLADVSLGALLSGGIDSSTIVALMQAQSDQPVKTFSIGFHDKKSDESGYAEAIAKHLGTDHTTLMMQPQDMLDMIVRIPQMYDEPFADSSLVPTSIVMSLAKKQVSVALSGDAGDELFGGYNRYFLAPQIWGFLKWIPPVLRGRVTNILLVLTPNQWDKLMYPLAKLMNQSHIGDKIYRLAQRLQGIRNFDDLYLALVTEWGNTDDIVLGVNHESTDALLLQRDRWPSLDNPIERMMALDAMTYMSDDILVKVDRAAMAVSLETRAPFLDHRVAELAWRIPLHQKIRNGQGKWLLRQVLYQYVPSELIDRPKMGFGIPLDDWLRGPLRDWADALLTTEMLSRDGLFNVTEVQKNWQQHLQGKRQYGYRLWSILMFQSWHSYYLNQNIKIC
jgi:asparagine synthase (glutamine-hydrolysing)